MHCGVDLHVCLNCKLYSPSSPNQCLSATTEKFVNKDKMNFCEEFEFLVTAPTLVTVEDVQKEKAKKGFDDLFKSGS